MLNLDSVYPAYYCSLLHAADALAALVLLEEVLILAFAAC